MFIVSHGLNQTWVL